MRTRHRLSVLALMLVLQANSPGFAQNLQVRPAPATHGPAMTNADVIGLASAGLDDAVILAKIGTAPATAFDCSVEGLKALKVGGVSNNVIREMVSMASAADALANSDDPNVVHQPGVYILISGRDGQVHLLMLEHTHAIGEKMSGNSIAMAYGLGKKHTRSSLSGSKSPVQIDDRNPTFYIYIPEDTQTFGGNDLSVRDFALLQLNVKSTTREVQLSALSAAGMGTEGGVEEKARRPTTAQKVKPGIYMVKLLKPLHPGEYAIEHEAEGVFYDFGVSNAQ